MMLLQLSNRSTLAITNRPTPKNGLKIYQKRIIESLMGDNLIYTTTIPVSRGLLCLTGRFDMCESLRNACYRMRNKFIKKNTNFHENIYG